ncbi:hypothetical protein DYL59_30545 [Pseudomonas kairouanensis]|uniref:Uncharacterized protein n=1 Tax=Pseudomonas kairouanensis TaxID=2293832 RepID=A0A4Z0AB13_9PSED|nr:hypothetical protein DYL59_30545 [Pseudomonas kairouanensis]
MQAKMWERACSRIQSVSHRIHRLKHRIREQARSHILMCVAFKIAVRLRRAAPPSCHCNTPTARHSAPARSGFSPSPP